MMCKYELCLSVAYKILIPVKIYFLHNIRTDEIYALVLNNLAPNRHTPVPEPVTGKFYDAIMWHWVNRSRKLFCHVNIYENISCSNLGQR